MRVAVGIGVRVGARVGVLLGWGVFVGGTTVAEGRGATAVGRGAQLDNDRVNAVRTTIQPRTVRVNMSRLLWVQLLMQKYAGREKTITTARQVPTTRVHRNRMIGAVSVNIGRRGEALYCSGGRWGHASTRCP